MRAGAEYRPFPARLSGEGSPEINAGATAASVWSPGQGTDRSAAGVWNLAGNVSEWTATPCFFRESRASAGVVRESPVSHAREHRLEMLNPTLFPAWQRCRDYWVVGGSYRTEDFDFSKATRGRRSMRRDDIGFRCAVSADVALSTIKGGTPSPRRFHAVTTEE